MLSQTLRSKFQPVKGNSYAPGMQHLLGLGRVLASPLRSLLAIMGNQNVVHFSRRSMAWLQDLSALSCLRSLLSISFVRKGNHHCCIHFCRTFRPADLRERSLRHSVRLLMTPAS